MIDYQIEFTETEFQYLEHLKTVYDATNEMFINRQFGDYIPIGLAITHIATNTLESKYLNNPKVFNYKCIVIGKLFYSLIINGDLGMLGNDYIPIKHDVIIKWIKDIENNKSDNFANILIKLVSFENLYNVLINHSSISSNDNRISAIVGLWNGIKDTVFSFNSEYVNNDTLYNSIKHLRSDAEYKSILKSKNVGNPTIQRIESCIDYMKKINFEHGINLTDKGYTWKQWIAQLKAHNLIFIHNEDDFRKAANTINLFSFSNGRPKKTSKKSQEL